MRVRFPRRMCKLASDKRGGAAVEFALAAPFLLGGILVMADLGLAFNAQMGLDQAVRAGAGFAINGVDDPESLEELVTAAATGMSSEELDDVNDETRPEVEVTEFCTCPGSHTVVLCSASCGMSVTPSKYFDLEASRTFSGIFKHDHALTASLRVQVR